MAGEKIEEITYLLGLLWMRTPSISFFKLLNKFDKNLTNNKLIKELKKELK